MEYNFNEHLKNANRLYQLGDNASLRYCALELRFAIECHVYIQLRASLGEIPESVISTWQPPQAIKTLCMFEETADKDLKVIISGGGVEDITAEYKNIKYQDLSKWYNTLGSYLHQPTIKKQEFKIDRSKLQLILLKLTELCDRNLIVLSRGYDKIQCQKCGKDILFTKSYVEKYNKLYCQNLDCHNYLVIRFAGDGVIESFQSVSIPCFKCGEKYSMHLCDVEDGVEFICKVCKNNHVLKLFIYSQDKVAPVPDFTFEKATLIDDKK